MSLILKWALIAAVVAWGVWTWRRMQVRGPQSETQRTRAPKPTVMQPTQACLHCGVHAAQAEMVRGARGMYCCVQHCQAHGDHAQS